MACFGFDDVGRIRTGRRSAVHSGYADWDSQRRGRYGSADGSVEWFGHGAHAPDGHVARIAAAGSADDHRFALHRTSAGRAPCRAGRIVNGLTAVVVQLPASTTYYVAAFRHLLRRAHWNSNPGPRSNAARSAASKAVSGSASRHHADTYRNAEIRRDLEPCVDCANPIVEPAYRNRCGYHVA